MMKVWTKLSVFFILFSLTQCKSISPNSYMEVRAQVGPTLLKWQIHEKSIQVIRAFVDLEKGLHESQKETFPLPKGLYKKIKQKVLEIPENKKYAIKPGEASQYLLIIALYQEGKIQKTLFITQSMKEQFLPYFKEINKTLPPAFQIY